MFDCLGNGPRRKACLKAPSKAPKAGESMWFLERWLQLRRERLKASDMPTHQASRALLPSLQGSEAPDGCSRAGAA